MEDQHYLFKDFDIFPDKKDGALVYSPENSARLSHKNLIALLQEVKASNLMHVPGPAFEKLLLKYNLQDTLVKKYLSQDLKIMTALAGDRFEKVFIAADDPIVSDMLQEYFSGRVGIQVFSDIEEKEINDKSLLLLFHSVYQSQAFDKIYQLAQQHRAWVITTYIANHYLVIDNIYTPQKGMPCHFCNYNRHLNLMMSNNTLTKTSWVNFSRSALSEDIKALVAMRISVAERGLIVFWLAKFLQNYLNPHDLTMSVQDVSRYSWVNLLTGEFNQEQAVHWFACQCQGEVADE